MSVKIPAGVREGLEKVRLSGETNMLDYNNVIKVAISLNQFGTADWLLNNKDLYAKGIFEGFEVEGEE